MRERLTWIERVRLAWEFTYPLVLLDLGWAVLLYGIIAKDESKLDSLYVIAGILLLAPWVVRRAIRKTYRTFSVRAVRDGQPVHLGYQGSLAIVWLLSWRMAVLLLALLLPVSMIIGAITDKPLSSMVPSSQGFANAVGIAFFNAVTSIALLPFLIPGMLRKRYARFELEVQRRGSTAAPFKARNRYH